MYSFQKAMGFEGIILYAKRKNLALNPVDQEVPETPLDSLEAMQGDFEHPSTDFYSETFDFTKSSALPPVPVAADQGSPYQPDETSDYFDLDDSADCSRFSPDSYVDLNRTNFYLDQLSHVPQARGNMDQNSLDSSENYGQYSETANVEDIAIQECRQDVEETCMCLGIDRDPFLWTHDQVKQWIVWQCAKYNIPEPNLDYFYVSGAELCSMTEERFKLYAPIAGPTLIARLEVWKLVYMQTTHSQTLPLIQNIPVPVSPDRTSSSGSLSPSPSSFSECESLPETPKSKENTCTFDDPDRLPEESVQHHRQTIQLHQFLRNLLLDGHYTDCIRWVNRSEGVFKIENSARVAKLWGKRKNRPAMNYDKLSRSIRQYYKKNIIKKTENSKRLVYRFCKIEV